MISLRVAPVTRPKMSTTEDKRNWEKSQKQPGSFYLCSTDEPASRGIFDDPSYGFIALTNNSCPICPARCALSSSKSTTTTKGDAFQLGDVPAINHVSGDSWLIAWPVCAQ